MAVALVTGATSGIGEAYARRLAADGCDLVLVARDQDRLAHLSAEFEQVGVRCEVIAADLGDREQLQRVEARLADDDNPIEVLVNNAGFGLNQRFVSGSLDVEQAAIDVMVTAVMRLTYAGAGGMVRRGNGFIVNVSSIAAFLPYGSYNAAKAWVRVFTQGLAYELRGTGVKAVAVCPGLVETQFHARAGMDMRRTRQWMWLTPQRVVDQTFDDVRAGKAVSIAGRRYRAFAAMSGWLPASAMRRVRYAARGR